MWKLVSSIALSIFLTCTLFFVVYGMAYLIVWKTIDWTQKIIKKVKEPALTKEDLERREREFFGRPTKNEGNYD